MEKSLHSLPAPAGGTWTSIVTRPIHRKKKLKNREGQRDENTRIKGKTMWCTIFLNYVQPPKIPSTISMSNTTLFIYVQLLTGQHDVSLIRQYVYLSTTANGIMFPCVPLEGVQEQLVVCTP